jgi:uncharacterized protein (TIGR04255 family)
MTKKLTKSPLTYVLGQIKISPIIDIQRHIPVIQENLRKDFPKFNEIETLALNVQPHQKEVRVNTQWHFYDKESSTGVLLEKDTIIFHTTNYYTFEKFAASLGKILKNLNEILNIGLYTRLGLRYINFVDENIEKFIQKLLLGFPLHFDDIKESNQGFHKTESVSKTKCDGILKLQATYTHVNQINKNDFILFVPPDLSPLAGLLTFIRNEPKDRFFLLDIDHFILKNGVDFEVKEIIENFESLHAGISNAFLSAITSEAKTSWGSK